MSALRARKRLAKISFTQNRRVHALWQSQLPSRFVDELPEAHVDVRELTGPYSGFGGYGGYVKSRFDEPAAGFASGYSTPGWQRAKESYARQSPQERADARRRAQPMLIEGEIVASSSKGSGAFAVGDRVFHSKFGYGAVLVVDGNKLTVAFDKAGEKKVVESFLERG